MKKRLFLLCLLLMLAPKCFGNSLPQNDSCEMEASQIKAAKRLNNRVEAILNSLSAEEKIGQLMFIGVSGTSLNADDIDLLEGLHAGGVILFDRNMDNPEQVKALNNDIQKHGLLINKGKREYMLPLFIAVDQEGGLVFRMKEQWPDGAIPAQEEIGATNDTNTAKKWATKVSKSLKYMGVNVNFAPVADLGFGRKRSFGNDANQVTSFVDAAMDGYASKKVISTLKHFPGIGRAVVDPHFDGSVIKESLGTLEESDLVPFAAMINKRNNDTFMVMISHLTYTELDKKRPSSLSKKIVTGLLKEKEGFNGIAITDDLEMGAIAKHYSTKRIGVKAINAGVDMALVCHGNEAKQKIYKGILKAYKRGEIGEERIDDCVRRILRAKLVNLDI